jgi:K+-sensing histidine kinase KdpD
MTPASRRRPAYNGTVDVGRRWTLARVGAASVAPVAAAGVLLPLRAHVLNTNLALVLVVVVLGAAVAGGRTAGIVGALSAALSYDFFLTQPYGSLTVERGDDIETIVVLGIIGLIAGELVARARRSEAAAIARRRELDRVQRRAELAAGGESRGRLIMRSAEELTEILDLKACRFVPAPPPDGMPLFTHSAIRVPGSLASDVPPGAAALPVRAHGRDIGHFVMVFPTASFGIRASPDAKHAAVALADQLGMALLRYDRP